MIKSDSGILGFAGEARLAHLLGRSVIHPFSLETPGLPSTFRGQDRAVEIVGEMGEPVLLANCTQNSLRTLGACAYRPFDSQPAAVRSK